MIAIQPLTAVSIAPAAQLLAGSMRDNPLHLRVFAGSDARIEPLLANAFASLLRRQIRTGLVLAAYDADALVGVAAMVAPGHCQPTLRDSLAMLVILARGRALRHLPRIRRWLRDWEQQDPDFDHWHLGPAAVDRTRQGQGIGSALMAEICTHLDRRQGIGYLETDKYANVRLYRRGGFKVISEQPVLGVTNWFMLRRPQPCKRAVESDNGDLGEIDTDRCNQASGAHGCGSRGTAFGNSARTLAPPTHLEAVHARHDRKRALVCNPCAESGKH